MAKPEEKAIVYCRKDEPFKGCLELDTILETLDKSKVSRVAPYMPKGGDVFVYAWDKDDPESSCRWRCDHHRWRQYGGRRFPFSRSKYFKAFSSIILDDCTPSNAFQRITFTPLDTSLNLIIIHYIGDHTLSKVPYHFKPRVKEPQRGNLENIVKSEPKPEKSVLGIKRPKPALKCRKPLKSRKSDTATDAYQQAMQSMSDDSRSKILGWLNLKGLASHLDGFIQRMTVVPVTVCICGSNSMIQEFTKLLELKASQPQIMWFRNTKRVEDYYVTSLMFRHLLLEGSPLMPLVFAIHDDPLEDCVQEILNHVTSLIPKLASIDMPIVVDRNLAKAVNSCLPRAQIIYSWGHIREEVRRWTRATGFHNPSQFTSRLPEFLDCRSEEQYDSLLEMYSLSWPENWVQFFKDELTHDIKQCSVRWKLEEYGVFSSYTGVVSQLCDGYETVVDDFSSVQCVTVDMLVLAFHYLHNYLIRQSRVALCGLPCAFNLKREFREVLPMETEITVPETSVQPENIVKMIEKQFKSVTEDGSLQFTPREYVASHPEVETAPETIVEEPKEDVVLIQAVDDSSSNILETLQLTNQTGLQRSLLNGKLFHTYHRNDDKLF